MKTNIERVVYYFESLSFSGKTVLYNFNRPRPDVAQPNATVQTMITSGKKLASATTTLFVESFER